jgi:hypothetical protein
MKKQTAMMEHIKWLYEVVDIAHAQNMNQDIIQAIEYIIGGAKAKLPTEKDQLVKFYIEGCLDTYGCHEPSEDSNHDKKQGESYYNKTYI